MNGEKDLYGIYKGASEGGEGARAEYVEAGEGGAWLVLAEEERMALRGFHAREHGENRRSYSRRWHCEGCGVVSARGRLSELH